MTDLACIGLTTLDVTVCPLEVLPSDEGTLLVDSITLSAAGTAGGTALIAATLGLNTALISQVGADINGETITTLLQRAGVNTDHVQVVADRPTSTTLLAISASGARPNVHQVGASIWTSWSKDAISLAKSARFLHLGGVGYPNLSSDDALNTLQSIAKQNTFISCDLIGPSTKTHKVLTKLLPYVDLFMPSAAEAQILLGSMSTEAAAKKFTELGANHCLIKQGAQGVAGMIDHQPVTIGARTITPIDTTSCGDAFCAGTIAGLANGMTLHDAARFGSTTASFVAQGVGTQGALTSFNQVTNAVSELT